MNKAHLSKLDAIMQEMVDTEFVAGCSILVLQDGEEQYFGAKGYRDIENKIPFTRDTMIRLYSMSKPVTAVAAMILLEEGKLALHDNVCDILPAFRDQCYAERYERIPVKKPMRIKDLLNMTSGLTYNGILNVTEAMLCGLVDEGIGRIGSDNEMTTMEFAERIAKLPLMFSPGEGYNYSFSADVLGAVIEKVSGMRFSEFLKERIFKPLGMNDTDFYVPAEKQNRLSKVYEKTEEGLKEYNYNNLLINLKADHAPAFESGGAGLMTTLDDYAKFATMLQKGGTVDGVRIIGEQTIKFMTEASMEDMPLEMYHKNMGNDGYEYCNLIQIMKDPSKAIAISTKGEYGWDGWLGPYFINDPVNKVTMLVGMQLTNAGTTPYTRKLKNIVFSSI